MQSALKQDWPVSDLEEVKHCPYCGAEERSIAYSDVQDWSFQCAPGRWTYWNCEKCDALYLNPRPLATTIGRAYSQYYTHQETEISKLQEIKTRIRNENISIRLGANLEPRLHLPSLMKKISLLLNSLISIPYTWEMLARKKGNFVDVGCGSGDVVLQAKQFGWNAIGIEIDAKAVQTGQSKGLNIVNGTYEELMKYSEYFDCIVCSHVLEHLYDPIECINIMSKALKPKGILLLSLPNSTSELRYFFGENWRGLEAPRHISIPSEKWLITHLKELGFSIENKADNNLDTAVESLRIIDKKLIQSKKNKKEAKKINITPLNKAYGNDFIKLILTKEA